MAFALPIHLRLLLSRLVCFAATVISMAIYSQNASSTRIRITPFRLMYRALMIQCSVCSVELVGQSMTIMCLGSTAPLPKRPSLCVLLIVTDWLLAFFTVGTACMSLGVLTSANNIFDRPANARAMIHCSVLSLVAGASAGLAAFLSGEIAKARRRQAHK